MKKFDGLLICTDLDGTLFNSEHTVSDENAAAIEYFKGNGGAFTFITGRPPYTSLRVFDIVKPNAPFGCFNGGALYDGKKRRYISRISLSRNSIRIVDGATEKFPDVAVHIYTPELIYFYRPNAASERYVRTTGVELVERDIHKISEDFCKVVFAHNDPERLALVAEYAKNHPAADEFDFIGSEQILYEILPKGVSKGSLITSLSRHLGIDVKNTVAVGDFENDISMIREAGIGYAVANAADSVKAAADRITVSNDEHAISRIIEDLDREI